MSYMSNATTTAADRQETETMTTTMTAHDAYVGSHTSIVGENPELAEVGNPSGAIFETIYFAQVQMSDTFGVAATSHRDAWVWAHDAALPSHAEAQRLVDRINATGRINGRHWRCSRPAYGSDEWERDEQANEERARS